MKESIYIEFQKRVLNLYVEHPEVKRIWKRLDKNRWILRNGMESDDSPIHIFIEGKSGAGKSQAVKKYLKQNKGYTHVDENGDETDIKPVLYMNMPVPFTYKGFYNNILKSMGIPPSLTQIDVDKIKNQVFQLLKDLKVEMLIIDELDYLLVRTYVQRRDAMETIKDIANSTDVCLVCVGTNEIETLRTLNTQHIRRYPRTVFNHFQSCNEKFLDFLNEVEKQLGLDPGIELGWGKPNSVFAELLFELTGGLVGFIKPIIHEAMDLVGVFEEDFCDIEKLYQIDGEILDQAQKNIIGDLAEKDLAKILENKDTTKKNDDQSA